MALLIEELHVLDQRDDAREYPSAITAPPLGFLRSYVDYASRCTDAPRIFHVTVGLCLLGVAAGNRIWISAWGKCLRLNLWVLLVASSTIYRKSQSIDLGIRILRQALPTAFLPDAFSIEALQAALAAQPAGLITASELSTLWSLLARDYNKGGLPFLMTMYDGGQYRRLTKVDGSVEIKDAALSLLAGTTPDWMLRGLKADDAVTSGMLPRFLLVPAIMKERRLGYVDYRDERIEQELSAHLVRVSKLQGRARLDDAARREFERFLLLNDGEIEEGHLPRELEPIYGRLQTTVLKAASLYQLAAPEPGLTITVDAFYAALGLVKRLTAALTRLLTDEVAYSKAGEHVRLIKRRLREADGQRLRRSDLVRKLQHTMSAQELAAAIRTLIEAEEVRLVQEPTRGRAAQWVELCG